MTTDTNNTTQCLIAMLKEQDSLAQELSLLSSKQSRLIENGQSDALLSVLSVRQGIINKFVASQGKLAELLAEVQSPTSETSNSTRQQIAILVETINTKLADVMNSDKQDQDQLQIDKSRTKGQLAELDAGEKAHRAYTNVTPMLNRFADSQG